VALKSQYDTVTGLIRASQDAAGCAATMPAAASIGMVGDLDAIGQQAPPGRTMTAGTFMWRLTILAQLAIAGRPEEI
jgi:hypothetical protein